MIKILFVIGTRPEAIKMAPLIKSFEKELASYDVKVCVTGQHRYMLDRILQFFQIIPDFDLDLMRPNQNLYDLTANVIVGLKPVLESFKPDYVFVHGDTTTSTAAALAAFYSGSRICHVEAGLRTNNKLSPFPEEMNRQLTARLTDIHFAPTEESRTNLLKENIPLDKIVVTGNTVIDALLYSVDEIENGTYDDDEIQHLKAIVDPNRKMLLVTGHRRENFGDGMINICNALKEIARNKDYQVIYPVHLNPNVQGPVYEILGSIDNVSLTKPLGYPAFVWLMNKSRLILTDSGGVQEEAPSLGKPVLVMRENTERPEAVTAGTVKLVGTDKDIIVEAVRTLMDNDTIYNNMSKLHNPYGDGKACERIIDHLNVLTSCRN
jgi:UDP-N-acetylglucosamine 2-epimerase (non-hydrolysing)